MATIETKKVGCLTKDEYDIFVRSVKSYMNANRRSFVTDEELGEFYLHAHTRSHFYDTHGISLSIGTVQRLDKENTPFPGHDSWALFSEICDEYLYNKKFKVEEH